VLLATLTIRGGACASQPRAGRGQLALALERDGAGAQRLVGLALELAVPGERDAGRHAADQPRVGRDEATQSRGARRGEIRRLQGIARLQPYQHAVLGRRHPVGVSDMRGSRAGETTARTDDTARDPRRLQQAVRLAEPTAAYRRVRGPRWAV
jgi:hypothetical protein